MALRGVGANPASPPYSTGPYTWDQELRFTKTGGFLSCGTSSSDKVTTTTADTKFMRFYLQNSATSGDNRGMYLRLYLSGAHASSSTGGEALRVFTTKSGAGGTAHGAHISLSFTDGTTYGTVTGLGVAMRATLHIPNSASWTGGTLSAIQAEIWSDGSASDPDGLTELSFIRIVNGGDATGDNDVETDAAFLSMAVTPGSGSIVDSDITALTGKAGLRVNVNGVLYGYIPIVTGS